MRHVSAVTAVTLARRIQDDQVDCSHYGRRGVGGGGLWNVGKNKNNILFVSHRLVH